jgi:hypothetical protein
VSINRRPAFFSPSRTITRRPIRKSGPRDRRGRLRARLQSSSRLQIPPCRSSMRFPKGSAR